MSETHSAEKDVALLREAADLIERERGAHPVWNAVADWLVEAADHLAVDLSDPTLHVCPTAREGSECSMLGQALVVARTYVTPPAESITLSSYEPGATRDLPPGRPTL